MEPQEKDGNYWFNRLLAGEDIGYWEGPKPTPAQQEKIMQGVFKHIEEFPNGVLATKNPEYVEEYLNRVDLDLPDGISPSE